MANTRFANRHKRRSGKDNGSFWISFSDLMSSLLLIFILIMFYIMYQYFDMYEISMAEIARQQFNLNQANETLSEQQGQLDTQRSQLQEQEDQLSQQQEKLTAAEQQMIAQQIRLNAAQEDLDSAEAILASQQEELNKAQSLLYEKETELAAQQEQLDALSIQLGSQLTQLNEQQEQLTAQAAQINAQQAQIDTQIEQLEDQQREIEQLVGVRTRIIRDLSDALRSASISAAVDPASGAITLESSVLFPTNSYTLSDAGKAWIDAFLPVYLDVLFSDAYKDYISEVIIEGHTDSDGGYQTNLILSQQRALSVASYVLDDNYRGISAEQKALLRQRATVNGRSYMDRIFVNGVEDKDASRRVVFKFRMTDEEMIEQMQAILESDTIHIESAGE